MATTALRFSSGGITSTFTAWMHVEPTQTSWLRVSCLVKNALPACGAFTGSMVITPGDAANIRLRGTAKSILPAGATRQDGGSGMRGGGPCDLDPGDRDVRGRVRPPWMACRPSRILSRTQHPVGGGSRCGRARRQGQQAKRFRWRDAVQRNARDARATHAQKLTLRAATTAWLPRVVLAARQPPVSLRQFFFV